MVDRTVPLPEETTELREDARFLEELLDELTPLQKTIVKLRWGMGVSRKEAATLLGITERVLKRELEEAVPILTANSELVREGRWCESRKSLILAYSLDLLSPRRAAKAADHLNSCLGCRRLVRDMRQGLQQLGLLAPLLPVGGDQASHPLLARSGELFEWARSGLSSFGSAKHQAVSLFIRTPASDTAAAQVASAGGFRGGGTMVAAVVACVAAGSSATYCAVNGVPNAVRDVAGLDQQPTEENAQSPARTEPKSDSQPVSTEQPAPSPAPSEPQPSAPPTNNAAKTETIEAPVPASPTSIGAREFGAERASSAARKPASAPTSGGGEFGP